jgi:hypothetical protein
MEQYAGIDGSVDTARVCAVDATGRVAPGEAGKRTPRPDRRAQRPMTRIGRRRRGAPRPLRAGEYHSRPAGDR